MSGRKSKAKGYRTEHTVLRLMQESGFAAERIPYQGGRHTSGDTGDITMPYMGNDLACEVKCLADGFKHDYQCLGNNDILFKKADNKPVLATLNAQLLLRIMRQAEQARGVRLPAEPEVYRKAG